MKKVPLIAYSILFSVLFVLMEWDLHRQQDITLWHRILVNLFYFIVFALWFFGTRIILYFKEKGRDEFLRIASRILGLLFPVFLYLASELPANELFLKRVLPYRILLGLALCFLIGEIVLWLVPNVYAGMYLCLIAAVSFGIANGIVIQLRTYPIAPADLVSIGTANSVAGGYSTSCTYQMVESVLVVLLAIGLYGALRKNGYEPPIAKKPYHWSRPVISALLIAGTVLWIRKVDFIDAYRLSNYDWDPRLSYEENGFLLSFTAQLHEMIIDRPDGYHKKTTVEALQEYETVTAPGWQIRKPIYEGMDFQNQNPIVITIMNESFTDWDVISDFSDSDEILPFFRSLQSDPGTVEYGYAYVSTRGGGTCKSEYEYLTGDSMQFLPSTIPYMMYSFAGVENLVRGYKSDGYTAIAMHPFFPTDWKRNEVYGDMGFDKFIYAGDYDQAYRDARLYETDEGDYLRMLKEIKAHPEPTFIFNVTLQNHGGYDMETFSDIAAKVQPPYEEYEDLSVFEGMMHQSDGALEMLMGELKTLDRPVVVAFFGDHQPALNTAFDEEILKNGRDAAENEVDLMQRLYATPYFIWTNFTDGEAKESAGHFATTYRGYDILSVNYLGVMTRYYAGGTLSAYENFLLSLRRDLPVINSNGYYDGKTWLGVDEIASLDADVQAKVNLYRNAEYMYMFDH